MSVKRQLPLLMILALVSAVLLCGTCSLEGNIAEWGTSSASGGGLSPLENSPADTAWYTANPSATYFYISTAEELAGLAWLVNSGVDNFGGETIMQTSDINLEGVNWKSINPYFAGTYDGGGHTISKLTIESASSNDGLFGSVSSTGVVKNIKLINVTITGASIVGGVVGSNNGTVENCYITGNVYGSHQSFGGVVGENTGGTVRNCSFDGKVTGNHNVGGVVAYNDGTVESCYAIGYVAGNDYVGGVVGSNSSGSTVQSCVALNDSITAAIDSEDYIGRVVGNLAGYILQNNYASNSMAVEYNTNTTYVPDDTANADNNKDGKDVASGTGTGQYNNQSWWSGTASFDLSESGPWKWDSVKQLPVLK